MDNRFISSIPKNEMCLFFLDKFICFWWTGNSFVSPTILFAYCDCFFFLFQKLYLFLRKDKMNVLLLEIHIRERNTRIMMLSLTKKYYILVSINQLQMHSQM